MSLFKSGFDRLPNEIYLCIFDYLTSIEVLYAFLNLNQRLNVLLKSYERFTWRYIDLTRLNPHVFKYYCLQKQINNEIQSIKLNNYQFESLTFSSHNRLSQIYLLLEKDYYLKLEEQSVFNYLEVLTIEHYALTWQKPFVICQQMKRIRIHIRNHWDLLDLLNSLPIVEEVDVTINYDVTSSHDNCSINEYNYSNKITDFSYKINSSHGLVYFVTDYSAIELLLQQLKTLVQLRLYIIGCLNTTVDSVRLENNLLKFLPRLENFEFFLQSYGGQQMESMDGFRLFKWHFGSYSNQLTDMHFLFTLPFQFQRLDECVNEYFLNGIKTSFQKPNENIEKNKLIGFNNVKHVDLSCSITDKLLILLRQLFPSLESIRFSSSTAQYLNPPSLSRQSRYFIHSVRTVMFDSSCSNQSSIVRLLPNLSKLIINQSLLNRLLEETGSGYVCQISELHVYTFQRHFLQDILDAFPNVCRLVLKTLLSDDEAPVRSYIDYRCHHKHRPVSVCDVLDEIFKKRLRRLKRIEVGCYFERDEQHIEAILSRLIRKYIGLNYQFRIDAEDFKSTRCGSVKIFLF